MSTGICCCSGTADRGGEKEGGAGLRQRRRHHSPVTTPRQEDRSLAPRLWPDQTPLTRRKRLQRIVKVDSVHHRPTEQRVRMPGNPEESRLPLADNSRRSMRRHTHPPWATGTSDYSSSVRRPV